MPSTADGVDPAPSSAEIRLAELGLILPAPPQPPGSYVPARRVGNLLFVAGQLPFVDGELQMRGRLGEALSTADGASQSKVAVLNALAIAKDEIGSLEGLGVVNMLVLVASAQNYFDQHLVANEASELLVKVLGEQGKHTRTSVGVACLPFNGAVEVQVMFTVPP